MSPRTSRRVLAVVVAATMTFAFTPQAVAAPVTGPGLPTAPSAAPKLPKDARTVPDRWIVQVSGASTADGGTARAATASQDQVLTDAGSKGLSVRRTASFTSAYNGMTVTASGADADQLRNVAGVVSVWPVLQVAAPPSVVSTTKNLESALAMTGADVAYSELRLTGKGIKVGVIDSGIDIDHPDLGGTGTPGTTPFPSPRVKWGYDFVGDAYAPSSDIPALRTPMPDGNPDDCSGHGTHVAGIIGANGNFAKGGVRGVAPQVTFGSYRVLGCDETAGTSTDVVLAAMDRTIADHMDVVNMSLGETYMSWPSYPTSVAAQTMQRAGVILVASAGNEGADGTFTTSTPSVSDAAISVAAFENTNIPVHPFTTSTGATVPYLPAGEGAPVAPTTGSEGLALAGPDGDLVANTACTQISPAVAGKAALISRGTCGFYDKALRAQEAGATAVVMYNDAPELTTITVAGDPAIIIPVVLISLTDGTALAAKLASGPVSLSWSASWVTSPNPVGGLVADYSSWGLAADLSLKPDLGAPGGFILSTFPIEKGSYATQSGTSMASPHVAGAIALLLQAKPELKGRTTKVRELLQTTGTLAAWSANPTGGELEPVHHQGGGLIQIVTALTTKQTVSPGKISLGEGSAGPRTTSITLTNTSTKPVTYAITKSDGVATLGSYIDSFPRQATATMSAPRTVTVPARGTTTVKVKITPPHAPATAIYGGWVTFTATGATTLHVPFAGMVGDYQSVKVLTGDGLPALAQLDADGYLSLPTGKAVFTMQKDDYPYVLLHLDYPVNDLRIDIYRVGWKGLKTPITPNYTSWITTGPTGKDGLYYYETYAFTGTYTTLGQNGTQLPIKNGTYVIVITVTKALASDDGRSDHETWTSPTFSITQQT